MKSVEKLEKDKKYYLIELIINYVKNMVNELAKFKFHLLYLKDF